MKNKSSLSLFVLVFLTLALVGCSCEGDSLIPDFGAGAAPTDVPAATAEPPVATDVPEVEPTAVPPTDVPAPTVVPDEPEPADTYEYEPGGDAYALGVMTVTVPIGYGEPGVWCRVTQTANEEYPAWVSLHRFNASSGVEAQWSHPTYLQISAPEGGGTAELQVRRDLWLPEDIETDPYEVANVKNSPLGLGWFVTGNGGTVTVNGDEVELDGVGVFQMPFAKDWDGVWTIEFDFKGYGHAEVWQGELITEDHTWVP